METQGDDHQRSGLHHHHVGDQPGHNDTAHFWTFTEPTATTSLYHD